MEMSAIADFRPFNWVYANMSISLGVEYGTGVSNVKQTFVG